MALFGVSGIKKSQASPVMMLRRPRTRKMYIQGFKAVFVICPRPNDMSDETIETTLDELLAKAADEAVPTEAELRTELEAMKSGALRKRAAASGATEDQPEEADDSDDTRAAFVELIMANEKRG